MSSGQEWTFSQSEGDAWFARNRSGLGKQRVDWPTRMIAEIEGRDSMRAVCELGCSNGWRLDGLRALFSPECKFSGIDASREAIAAGAAKYPGIDLRQSVLSKLPFRESFDITIVNFVLHWIDRDILAACVSEIDRLVKPSGYLILGDFLPDIPTRRHYHHLPDRDFYTYKQNYAQVFASLGIYDECKRVVYSHDHLEISSVAGEVTIDPNDRAAVSVLRKRYDLYTES